MGSRKIQKYLMAILIAALGHTAAWACGPFFPCDYLVYGGRELRVMPSQEYAFEAPRILERFGYGEAMARWQERHNPLPTRLGLWDRTVRVAREDFAAAVATRADAAQLTAAYDDIRFQIAAYAVKRLAHEKEIRKRPLHFPAGNVPASLPVPPEPFEADTVAEQIALLPPEFALYLRGAIAWHNRDYEAAIPHFRAVIALSPGARKHRSTWAAFMLGKAYAQVDPAQAAPWFEETRALAAAGFPDPLELAGTSLFWQALAESKAGAYVESIYHFAEAGTLPSLGDMFLQEVIDPAVAADPLCREIVTAALLNRGSHINPEKWLAAIEALGAGPPISDAGRLAWVSYNAGDMTLASRWAALGPPDEPYALWVRGKLALRENRLDEGARLLEQAARGVPADARVNFGNLELDSDTLDSVVWADAAMAALTQGRYAQALTAFLEAGHWSEAAFVAERVLTVEELADYLEENAGLPLLAEPIVRDGQFSSAPPGRTALYYLYARRLARAGDWEGAASHYPDFNVVQTSNEAYWHAKAPADFLRRSALEMAQGLGIAHDTARAPRERAEALFDAAYLLREHGLALAGTELAPDWRIEGGVLDVSKFRKPPVALPELDQTDFSARVAQSAAQPGKRFHYRYTAAELMWQSAALLPDNDPSTAEALYLGGTWLQNRDPEAADRFYKALVRRNPNLLIAQQADKLRWFPKEFTAEVLYTPRPKAVPPLLRKRHIALIAVGSVAVILVGAWLVLRTGRNKVESA
jgi:tetratricopeptide (TPR) repeat protein